MRVIFSAMLCGAMVLGTCAADAAASTTGEFVDFTFTGEVTDVYFDTITAINPDQVSSVQFRGADVPDYRFRVGDTLTTRFRFASDQPAFRNSACNGQYSFAFAGAASSGCTVQISEITTPFGTISASGGGADFSPSINGLNLLRDASTGEFSVALPNGAYTFGPSFANPIIYDSVSRQLLGVGRTPCAGTASCPGDPALGEANSLLYRIPIVGNVALDALTYGAGYQAGTAGALRIAGAFSVPTRTPIDVPEPSMLLLFGGGVAGLMARRRRKMTKHG